MIILVEEKIESNPRYLVFYICIKFQFLILIYCIILPVILKMIFQIKINSRDNLNQKLNLLGDAIGFYKNLLKSTLTPSKNTF